MGRAGLLCFPAGWRYMPPLTSTWTKHQNLYCHSYAYKDGGHWFSEASVGAALQRCADDSGCAGIGEHQPHLTLATEKRGVSPPAPGADMPGPPDPRGAIAIRVICLGFATCLHVLVHAQCNCTHLPSIVF